MNKRSLLNLAMCSLLLGSMPMGLVGCKDYDGDIKDLNTTTGNLSSQLSSLQSALETAQNAATAAANDAKAAADKADKATEEVALAKKAAEEAKADAIAAAIAEVEKLQSQMNDMNADTAKELAALAGRIDGIEDGLNNIDLTEVDNMLGGLSTQIQEANKQISAINVQLKALETLKTDVPAMKSSIEAITTELNAVKAKANSNEASINEIKGELTKISAKISSEVSNAVNTIAGILAQRLTSVTLVPELYVGGIPTIEFESAKYTKKVFKDNKWVAATGDQQTEFIITNNATTAQYRLNPGTLKTEDIDVAGMAYVTKIATTRAADPVVVTVSNAKVEDNGLLTVNLGKANTLSLNLPDNKIYTVSLKVPVAAKHLFDGEASAEVYSEFTRLSETYFTPELRFVTDAALVSEDNNGHLWNDSTVLYSSTANQLVAKNIVYNKTFDLSTLVEGCKFLSTHTNLSVADLEKYGLGIKYQVATKAYEPSATDKTNQQRFAKINGTTLTPIAASGAEGNENIIGKEPIIRATLYDLNNNNVIEVGYFKVKFTAEDMQPVSIPLAIEDNATPCLGATHEFKWEYMAEEVLEKLNGGKGMSKEEFNRVYTTSTVSAPATDEYTVLTVTPVNNTEVSTPVMTWEASPIDLGALTIGANSKVFKRTVTFKNPAGLYPDVVLNLEWTVSTNVPAVALGSTSPIKWSNNTMKIVVVPMQIPYTAGTSPRAHYNTNILEGRDKPYVTGLTSCAHFNVEYAPTTEQPQAYVGQPLTGFTQWALNNDNQKNLTEIGYVIANTADGQKLVASTKTVKVDVKSDINGIRPTNVFKVGTINLEVLKILNLNLSAANGFTDNTQEISFDLINNIRITDAYGNVVANKNSSANSHEADYWDFYGVKNPEFNVAGIKVSLSADGANASTLAENNMTASIENDGTLKFKNGGGVIQSDFYLLVPVTIEHLWGTKQNGTALTGNIIVPVKKKL